MWNIIGGFFVVLTLGLIIVTGLAFAIQTGWSIAIPELFPIAVSECRIPQELTIETSAILAVIAIIFAPKS